MSDSQCCVTEESKPRCKNPAGPHTFQKRYEKIVQKKNFQPKMYIDKKAGHNRVCGYHKAYFNSFKPKKHPGQIGGEGPSEGSLFFIFVVSQWCCLFFNFVYVVCFILFCLNLLFYFAIYCYCFYA